MKTLVTALALATVIAAPAFAQKPKPAPTNSVIVDDKVVGQDPDANIRFELRKEYMHGVD